MGITALATKLLQTFWKNQEALATQGITIASLEADLSKGMTTPLLGPATTRFGTVFKKQPGSGLKTAAPWLLELTGSATNSKGMGFPRLTCGSLTGRGSSWIS